MARRKLTLCCLLVGIAGLTGCPGKLESGGGTIGYDTDEGLGDEELDMEPDLGAGTDTGDEVVEDHRSYFIAEITKHDEPCAFDDINAVTEHLATHLDAAGWSGQRLVNLDTSPEHFWDKTVPAASDGLDHLYADAAKLSVFAGHGNEGLLAWGQPAADGGCFADLAGHVALGTEAGDTAAAVMFISSCTMRSDRLWNNLHWSASRQIMGYHDSPHVGAKEPRKVFERTQDGQATADAWLEEMETNIGGKHSPVVMTWGIDYPEALQLHDQTNLATGDGLIHNVSEPVGGYVWEMLDNGCSKICGECGGSSMDLSGVVLGRVAPRLRVARPAWTKEELAQRATHILSVLLTDHPLEVDAADPAIIAAWAEQATHGEVTFARVGVALDVDVSYDRTTDELRIVNRSALANAREDARDSPLTPELTAAERLEQAEAARGALADMLGFDDAEFILDWDRGPTGTTLRTLGLGEGEGKPRVATIEYIHGFHVVLADPSVADLAIAGQELRVGITRLGELSSVLVSTRDVEVVDQVELVRQPSEALAGVSESLAPSVIEVTSAEVGYALVESALDEILEPSLLMTHVITNVTGVVGRGEVTRISLTSPDLILERLTDDPSEFGAKP